MDFVRKLMGALLICTFSVCDAHAEFRGVLNTPASMTHLAARRPLNSVAATASRLVAVGQRGHIIYSDNNGASWVQAVVPVRSDLTAVFFRSDRAGWAVGHDGVVLHTEDGGETWKLQLDGNRVAELMRAYYGKKAQEGDALARSVVSEIDQNFAGGADKPFLDVWFASDTDGFVVGAFNMIFRTSDGGKTWEPWFHRINNPKRLHIYSIRGRDGRVYAVGEQGLVACLDLGTQRFEAIYSPYSGSFFGVLPYEGGAVVFGMRGNAFRLDGKGENWRKLETGAVGGLTAAAILDNDRLALVSTAGEVLVGSASTGQFERLRTPRAMVFAGVAVIRPANSLVLVGNTGPSVASLAQK